MDRLSFAQIPSLVWRLPSLKVTPPKPGNFGFKNHFDLIFYREHGRLSEFNLSLSKFLFLALLQKLGVVGKDVLAFS